MRPSQTARRRYQNLLTLAEKPKQPGQSRKGGVARPKRGRCSLAARLAAACFTPGARAAAVHASGSNRYQRSPTGSTPAAGESIQLQESFERAESIASLPASLITASVLTITASAASLSVKITCSRDPAPKWRGLKRYDETRSAGGRAQKPCARPRCAGISLALLTETGESYSAVKGSN